MPDPLRSCSMQFEIYGIKKMVSVYPDQGGTHHFTKAWFNNSKNGEQSVQISYAEAIKFWTSAEWNKEEWLEKFFPERTSQARQAEEKAKNILIQNYESQQQMTASK